MFDVLAAFTMEMKMCISIFHKYTNIDQSSTEGDTSVGYYFICQLAPDIWCKLQKFQMGPQTTQLPGTIFSVFKNLNPEEGQKRKTKIIAVIIEQYLKFIHII